MLHSKRKHLHVLLYKCKHLLALKQNPPPFCKIKCWGHRDELCSHFTSRENCTGQFSDRVGILDGKYSPIRLSPDMTRVLPGGYNPPKGYRPNQRVHTCIGKTLGFVGKQHASNRIRGFELSVPISQGILRVFLTVFLPPVRGAGVHRVQTAECTGVRRAL